ncbi:hypothetical protein TNCV_1684991 [Trichonephila clavipes]|nr:hypothetical protein TNCV_1684991 [Trichonephila clavipes]
MMNGSFVSETFGALKIFLVVRFTEYEFIVIWSPDLWDGSGTDAQLAVLNDPDMLDWRQMWGSGRPKIGSNSTETVRRLPCCLRPCIVLLINDSWEQLHEWQHLGLQDVMDVPLGYHGSSDVTRGGHVL